MYACVLRISEAGRLEIGAIDRANLRRTFQDAARAAGVNRRVTPHALRHSYATRLLENGVDTRVVQILLGRVHIATTAICSHLTEPTHISLRGVLDTLMSGL
jgi:site-specific recombinase XerD